MSRTQTITVNEITYSVGWNEFGWFACREDGTSTRGYCVTLDEVRQAVADGDWEPADPDEDDLPTCQECAKVLEEDHLGNWRCPSCHAKEVGRNFLDCCGETDYAEWFDGDEDELAEVVGEELIELVGHQLIDLGGEGGGA